MANEYAATAERIYELSHCSGLGGLISVQYLDCYPPNGGRPTVVVSIYRQDPDVLVLVEGHDVQRRAGCALTCRRRARISPIRDGTCVAHRRRERTREEELG